jgi:hypothetical protein
MDIPIALRIGLHYLTSPVKAMIRGFILLEVLKMTYDKVRYFELLEYSKELEKKGKTLYEENPEALSELLSYQILIEDNFLWEKKREFVSLIQNFIIEIKSILEFLSPIQDLKGFLVL